MPCVHLVDVYFCLQTNFLQLNSQLIITSRKFPPCEILLNRTFFHTTDSQNKIKFKYVFYVIPSMFCDKIHKTYLVNFFRGKRLLLYISYTQTKKTVLLLTPPPLTSSLSNRSIASHDPDQSGLNPD